jgi:hypothetical protein
MSLESSWLSFEGQHAARPPGNPGGGTPAAPLALEPPVFMRKVVSRPGRPGQGYKFGIFAGLHGDEEAGVLAEERLIE